MTVSITPERALEDRELGRVRGAADGPTLVCVAALHGNEPAGVEALRRVLASIEGASIPLRGELVGLIGNRKALALRRRFLSRDLNRLWTEERVRFVTSTDEPLEDPEDEELLDLYRALEGVFETATGTVYLLDLHTTSGPGPAFAVLDDTLENRSVALELPVPVVLGIEEELDGTLASFLLARGAVTVGFECGQHDDEASIDRGEAAIWIALEACGLTARGERPEAATARRTLAAGTDGLPRVVETLYRHPIPHGQSFRSAPALESFQPVRAGQTIAWADDFPVAAPRTGRVLMPLYQSQGEDGFFIVRDVRRFWLGLSSLLRRVEAERIVHWLPGVRRCAGDSDLFVVDRRVARWYALEILHLLGFRRHGDSGRFLEVSRRQRPRLARD